MPNRETSEFEKNARIALDVHEASEIVRRQQQGLGKPIISVVSNGYRLVAVGKRIKWSKNWRFFSDFLIDHLKDTIGRPWAIQAQRESKGHPIFEWLVTMQGIASASGNSKSSVFNSRCKGHLGALWRLGYALYLIDHNDELDHQVVRRLRSPRSFLAAYHETQMAAVFAVSGFEIRMAEIGRRTEKTPEFWATLDSGERYSVEAKCKNGWTASRSVNNENFKSELRKWISNQIYNSSIKNLSKPIFCFELSIDEELSSDEWNIIFSHIKYYIKEAEDIKIKGKPASPEYVIITNNADVLRDNDFQINRIAMIFGFKMENWLDSDVEVDVEIALEWHDFHRYIYHIFRWLEEIEEIPQSFDGMPKYLDDSGDELDIEVRIGAQIEYPDANSVLRTGTIYDVCSTGDEAFASVRSDGGHHIVRVPLLPHEAESARRYGDAIFGKPEEKRRDLKGDPILFYEWIRRVFNSYDREALLNQIKNHPDNGAYSSLSLENLRIRAAREVTKAAIAYSGRPGQV
jgi:hypothetical protein